MVWRVEVVAAFSTAPGTASSCNRPYSTPAIMGLKEDFDKAAEEAKSLPDNTSDDDKLALYGLFKQATVGDNNTDKPGFLDFKGKAKHAAWEKQKGKSQEAAMQEYIELVASLKSKYA